MSKRLDNTKLSERIKKDVRRRLTLKSDLDATTAYSVHGDGENFKMYSLSTNGELTFTVFQEGYVLTGLPTPDFFYKGTLANLYDRMDEQPIEILADHESVFTVATVSKKDFSLEENADGRQRLDVTIKLDDTPVANQLKAQYKEGQIPAISAEFFSNFVYNEELEAFAANHIELESIAFVRNPAVVQAFGDKSKDSYSMSKGKHYESEESVVTETVEGEANKVDETVDTQVDETVEQPVDTVEDNAPTEEPEAEATAKEAEDAEGESKEVEEDEQKEDVADQVVESYKALQKEVESLKEKIAEYEAKEESSQAKYSALESKYSALNDKLGAALDNVEVRKNYEVKTPESSNSLFSGVEVR